jgi:excisionase family DNA binding protein
VDWHAWGVHPLDSQQLELRLDRDDTSPPAGHDVVLITVKDAGRMLGVGRTSAYELVRAGELELVHVRRSARVPIASVHAYVDRLRDAAS